MLKILSKAATLQGGTGRLFCLLLVATVLIPAGLFTAPVSAQTVPATPAVFSGSVSISGSPAPVGTAIQAQVNSIACSTPCTVTTTGSYPNMLVTCGNYGDTVQFYVNGVAAQTAVFHPGEYNRVDLSTGGGGSAPAAPVLSLPASGATAVSVTPTLQWTASSGATSYAVQVSTSSSFATIAFSQSGITATSITVSTALTAGTLYYWRANAANSYGTSAWATAWSFTTATVAAPTAPILLSPSNGATGVATSPLLQWSPSTGATSYNVQVSTSSTFSSFVFTLSGSATAATVTPALSNSATYYWRANATGSGGTSSWSSTWSFTTSGGSTPGIPAFFKGIAYKDGTAVNTKQVCAATGSGSNCTTSDASGNYLVSVTGNTGNTVSFTVDGSTATETATYSPGWMTTLNLHSTTGGPLTVTTTSLPSGATGSVYSTTLTASGGSLPYSWAIVSGSLPSWAALTASTGVIYGTPTAPGSASFVVRVTDNVGATANSVTLTITAYAPGSLSVVTTSLPSGTVGTAYTTTLSATGGSSPYTWSVASGSLPAWAGLNASTGVIAGSTPTAGTSTFTVRVTDSASTPATALSGSLSITISAPGALTVGTTSLPGGTLSTAYSTTLLAAGGTTPYTWAVASGSLPSWAILTPSTGVIAGTPTATGTSTFTVMVTDNVGATATSGSLSIIISTYSGDAIGSTAGDTLASWGPYSVALCKFAAINTTTITKINLITSGSAGNVRVAIYTESGSLISANNTLTPVTAGLNSITISPGAPITSGTNYWLASWSDGPLRGANKDAGVYKFIVVSSDFIFPASIDVSAPTGLLRGLISGSN